MTNCVFEFVKKNIILLLQFNWLYQGPRPTGAICRLVEDESDWTVVDQVDLHIGAAAAALNLIMRGARAI